MQKIVTVSIDTSQLSPGKLNPFSVMELEEINEILEMGWQVEEWDFLKEGEIDGKVVLMVILNDDQIEDEDEDDLMFNNMIEDEEDDDEEYEEEEQDQDKANKL